MKILFVCQEFPVHFQATTIPVLNSLKYLSGKYGHDITLIAFKLKGKDYPDLSPYCRAESVNIEVWPGLNSPESVLFTLKNMFRGHLSLFNFHYVPEMDRKVRDLLGKNDFDVMIIDHPIMLVYATTKTPAVLLEVFELSEIAWMWFKNEKNWLKKTARLLYYFQMLGYARRYRAAAVSIAVSPRQKEIVLSHCPELDIVVNPTGIDTDYFSPVKAESPFPNLIITGSMDNAATARMVLYFYHEIYPLIKSKVPDIKLYIVGSKPGRELLDLAKDESVVVTGYVEDLRPYLSTAWVVVAPLQEGFGIKHRIQQAMAVGKPVVASSLVAGGIDAAPGENILIADEPEEFAGKVIELLNDRPMRERIGAAARQLMITKYRQEIAVDRLNEVLEKARRKGAGGKS